MNVTAAVPRISCHLIDRIHSSLHTQARRGAIKKNNSSCLLTDRLLLCAFKYFSFEKDEKGKRKRSGSRPINRTSPQKKTGKEIKLLLQLFCSRKWTVYNFLWLVFKERRFVPPFLLDPFSRQRKKSPVRPLPAHNKRLTEQIWLRPNAEENSQR